MLQTDSVKLRQHYMNSTTFYIDLLCLLPLDFLYLSLEFQVSLRVMMKMVVVVVVIMMVVLVVTMILLLMMIVTNRTMMIMTYDFESCIPVDAEGLPACQDLSLLGVLGQVC